MVKVNDPHCSVCSVMPLQQYLWFWSSSLMNILLSLYGHGVRMIYISEQVDIIPPVHT